MRNTSRKFRAGIVLLEVMLSVFVLSVGIVALSTVFSTLLGSVRNSRREFQAALLLESGLWELSRTGQAPAGGAGPDSPDLEGAQWKVDVHRDAPGKWPRRDLTLSWTSGKKREELSLSTFMRD